MADIVSLDAVLEHLNLQDDGSHDDELQTFIDAVTAHVEKAWGATLPSATITEIGLVVNLDGTLRLMPSKTPVLAVASISDGVTTHTTGFTVTADGYVEHDNLYGDRRWTIIYTAGFDEIPADLKLAALEDIRGLYQPGQIGPPAAFGAFGIESTDTGVTYRPVRMWPRVDAWLENDVPPGVA